jgi:nucleoside-diphosphate-sugar epimerase
MRVLVTGGSGFIGSRVVERLVRRGDVVCNVDIKQPTFSAHQPYWRRGDILDLPSLLSTFDEFLPDAIMHLAAKADVSDTEWEDYQSIHKGTGNVLAAYRAHENVKKFVNISTQLVIGPEHRPRSLLDFEPYTLYGEAKAYAEALLLQWQSSQHWVTIRPATIWGAYNTFLSDGIWKYIQQGGYLHPKTRQPIYRSYGYVDNTAQQMVAVLDAKPEDTYRKVFYAADGVMNSALWCDAFSQALVNRPARRLPAGLLKMAGYAGDALQKLGKPVPINSGRAYRMTQSYPVPYESMHALAGPAEVSFEAGVTASVLWLKAGAPARLDR